MSMLHVAESVSLLTCEPCVWLSRWQNRERHFLGAALECSPGCISPFASQVDWLERFLEVQVGHLLVWECMAVTAGNSMERQRIMVILGALLCEMLM